ncbi:MAG: M28 family peptidase, partial [Halobacteriales archaeon]|nr:M28 family peptidase [Halobacteriales archaeon]
TRVELVAYGAEEAGLVGSARHARSVDPGAIKAVVQLDGAGRDRELKLFTHGFEAFARVAERVGSQFDVSVEITPLHYLSSDHWRFVERGIPGGLVHDPSGGGERNTILTAADTLDKVDSRNLREHAIFLTEFVLGVASDEVQISHSTPAAVAAAIEQEGQASLAEHYARTVPEDILDADEVP